VLFSSIGAGTVFAFFAFMMFLQLLFVVFIMPETKGVSLEALSKSLSKSNGGNTNRLEVVKENK
jgi:hypothetical protein